MKRLVILVYCSLILGCGDASGGQPGGSLVDHEDWRQTEAGIEFFGVAPPDKGCTGEEGDLLYIAELLGGEMVLSVYTDLCDWVTLEQETLLPISEGATVQVRFFHFDLTSPSNSEANVGIAIGDELVWEEAFFIPSGSQFTTFDWVSPKDIPAGTQVLFHVDNHGNNEYSLVNVNVL